MNASLLCVLCASVLNFLVRAARQVAVDRRVAVPPGPRRADEVVGLDGVGDGEELAVRPEIEFLHLIQSERPRADTTEHGDLVAALVDAAVALQPARQRQRR